MYRWIVLVVMTCWFFPVRAGQVDAPSDEVYAAMEARCAASQPKVFCSCFASRLRTDIADGSLKLESLDREQADGITRDCLISTGIVRRWRNEAIRLCYFDSIEAFSAAQGGQAELESLRRQYPQKRARCDCMQRGLEAFDDLAFFKQMEEADANFRSKVECKIDGGDEQQCEKRFGPTAAEELEAKCEAL